MAAGDANEFFDSVPSSVTVNAAQVKGATGFGISMPAENAIIHTDGKQFAWDGGNIQNSPPVITLQFAANRLSSTVLETTFAPGGALGGALVVSLTGKGGAAGLTKTYTCSTAPRVNSISKGEMTRRATHEVELLVFSSDAASSGVVVAIA